MTFSFLPALINLLSTFYVVKKTMPSKYIYIIKKKKKQIKLIFKAFCFVSDIINDFVIFLCDLDQFSFVSMFVNCGD